MQKSARQDNFSTAAVLMAVQAMPASTTTALVRELCAVYDWCCDCVQYDELRRYLRRRIQNHLYTLHNEE